MQTSFMGPDRDGDFEVWRCESAHHVSVIALDRADWEGGWPALGGTRWLPGPCDAEDATTTARALARAMAHKTALLRASERTLRRERPSWAARPARFGWQGGKGVIAAPELTPAVLMAHGQLVERMAGTYVASKDQGVGTPELRWIERATRYTVGNRGPESGRATAAGVLGAIATAAARHGLIAAGAPWEAALDGLSVLVLGCGKVGWPLLALLSARGARCSVYDPALAGGIDAHFEAVRAVGAAVGTHELAALREVAAAGRLATSEADALARAVDIVSPNGGPIGWLGRVAPRVRATAIVGAGNAQLPVDPVAAEAALAALAQAGVTWVPDPAVSAGGVVAVSQELAASWSAEVVDRDACTLVARTVQQVYDTRPARLGFQGSA